MYRLLIVDDEEDIRRGMANSVPWETWGFQVCAQAENGKAAIDIIHKEPVDAVITDIRMPVMDGVELMRYLRENAPSIYVVVLSGYSDFAYMQEAIRNGAAEYLLKPTDIDEFETVFRRLKKRMDEAHARDSRYQAMLEEYQLHRPAAQNQNVPQGSSPLADAIRDIVDKEYMSCDMSLDYVAERLGKSTAYISRTFKEKTGTNFIDYLTKIRLTKAKELLKNPKYKVWEIGEQVGYNDPSNFIRSFKKSYGVSPNDFRSLAMGGK